MESNLKIVYRLLKDTPICNCSTPLAEKNLSTWLDLSCRDAIDTAIQEHHGEKFVPKDVLEEVLRDFSVERVRNILRNYMMYADSKDEESSTPQTNQVYSPELLLDTRNTAEINLVADLFRKRYDDAVVLSSKTATEELKEFFDSGDYLFAILQLKNAEEMRKLRFCSIPDLNEMGISPNIKNYNVVYKSEQSYLHGKQLLKMSKQDMLEYIYEVFNLYHPSDFYGHSLSVSDVIAIKRNRKVYYYYINLHDYDFDRTRFELLEEFTETHE